VAVDLPTKRREALRWVVLYPGRSARELERASGLRKINARLSELEAQGVVEGRGYTTCSVTGHTATAWRPTGLPPRPLVRRPTTLQRLRASENEVQQLRGEVERLRAALASAQRGQPGLFEVER
jgi:type II secretory pathway component PulM